MPDSKVLVIDDEKPICLLIEGILAAEGLAVSKAHRASDGLASLEETEFGVVFLDMGLPDMKGIDVLREIKRRQPHVPVVMITGNASKDSAVEAMRQGAYDYLAKPFNISDVALVAGRALERNRLIDENRFLREELRARYNFDNIVGSSEGVQAAYVLAAKVAAQNATVLITGESGTGKEMLARTIHYQSKRADKPFVKVNCAALPEHLLEDELFGHEKGAFTDASAQRIGRFEWAHTGTLFLDEIGEIPPSVQVKLLRVLQEKEFERIGSSKTIKVDVRILAATNKDLRAAIADGTFREDLYYRLNVVPIELPPLRERPEDVPQLAEHFIKKYADGKRNLEITDEAMKALQSNEWKGNIRELENCIERAVILAEDDRIETRHLLLSPDTKNVQLLQTLAVMPTEGESRLGRRRTDSAPLPTLREAEQNLIARALDRADGDESAAAEMLDITPEQLQEKRSLKAEPKKRKK
ncbi:MAG TPA: sigma-54 dependent transcriptional regulator [Abditibacteriaceae bacterium]|jgi:DNA-binding NtrC family response regulator